MGKDYREHIVSNDEHQVWLHRTSERNVDGILREGLFYGLDLGSTATAQPSDVETAEGMYRSGGAYGGAVIVIKIPREIARFHNKANGGEGSLDYDFDRRLTYFHPKRKGIAVQRKHVHGWIDRETGEYHPNPHRDVPQDFTDEHFPEGLYGGLEFLVDGTPVRKKSKDISPIYPGKSEIPPHPDGDTPKRRRSIRKG